MTRVAVVALVWLELVRDALRRHWRRLLVGAVVGWALASVLGAVVLFLLEPYTELAASQVSAVVFVFAGIAIGAVAAYAARRDDGQV